MPSNHNAQTHVFRYEPRYAAESAILSELVTPGMRVLDVGTAASGRSARLLRSLGADVVSIDINVRAILEFARHPERGSLALAAADMVALPFAAESFGLVLVAFHGLDYLVTAPVRRQALRGMARVLASGGSLVFNGFNRLGAVLSPSGLRSRAGLALRARHLMSGRFLRATLIDINRLELHQALPRRIISQVEDGTDLRFLYATNMGATTRSLARLTLFSTTLYYVFRRPPAV